VCPANVSGALELAASSSVAPTTTMRVPAMAPIFTPHVDTGDFVVVINAEKVILTGPGGRQLGFDPLADPILALQRRLKPGQWRWQHWLRRWIYLHNCSPAGPAVSH
jgi:hypothetical protein